MISLCITTYNRTDLLFDSFAQVLDDPRISEIVIVDDCSDEVVWKSINNRLDESKEFLISRPKIKLYRNDKNLDCYRNKREAISKATNEWCILLDSDNVITPDYLHAIDYMDKFLGGLHASFAYQPSFAKPHFDFRAFEYNGYDRSNVAQYMDIPNFETMLNAMNYFVSRDEYLRVWDGSIDPVTSDSLYQNYRWLEAGNSIYVVPGMHYEHRVHDGSHYKNNVKRTPRGFHDDIINRLKAMR